jgi:hypothetical protein
LSARAEARSCPNGFSTTMRAPSAQPDPARWSTMVGKSSGGMRDGHECVVYDQNLKAV